MGGHEAGRCCYCYCCQAITGHGWDGWDGTTAEWPSCQGARADVLGKPLQVQLQALAAAELT